MNYVLASVQPNRIILSEHINALFGFSLPHFIFLLKLTADIRAVSSEKFGVAW